MTWGPQDPGSLPQLGWGSGILCPDPGSLTCPRHTHAPPAPDTLTCPQPPPSWALHPPHLLTQVPAPLAVWAADMCKTVRLVLRSDSGERPPCLGGLGVDASPLLDLKGKRASLALHGIPCPPDHLGHQLPDSCRAELGLEPWPQLLCCIRDVQCGGSQPGSWMLQKHGLGFLSLEPHAGGGGEDRACS